jgi:hypothetical protein
MCKPGEAADFGQLRRKKCYGCSPSLYSSSYFCSFFLTRQAGFTLPLQLQSRWQFRRVHI